MREGINRRFLPNAGKSGEKRMKFRKKSSLNHRFSSVTGKPMIPPKHAENKQTGLFPAIRGEGKRHCHSG
jgi:hypothetical protein